MTGPEAVNEILGSVPTLTEVPRLQEAITEPTAAASQSFSGNASSDILIDKSDWNAVEEHKNPTEAAVKELLRGIPNDGKVEVRLYVQQEANQVRIILVKCQMLKPSQEGWIISYTQLGIACLCHKLLDRWPTMQGTNGVDSRQRRHETPRIFP